MSLTKPYTFSSGTIISSAQVNSDFDTLYTAVGDQMYTEENFIADDQTVTASLDALDMKIKDHDDASAATAHRSIFTYNGGTTAYTVKAKGAVYYCKDKFCFWSSELTTNAIGSPVADTWYYLYLDYSAVTSGTALTATELIWSSTAPTWSNTYRGWYNGDDRCIFAVLTNTGPTNIHQFWHEGDYVMWDSYFYLSPSSINPSTTWTDVDFSSYVPGFCTRCKIFFRINYVDVAASALYRVNGSATSDGHEIGSVTSARITQENTTDIIMDSSQIFEVKFDSAGTDLIIPHTMGWFFPIGM